MGIKRGNITYNIVGIRLLLLLFFSLMSLVSLMAQTGPGGVGTSSSNLLWLKAEDINQADASSVSSWTDASGNGNDFIQGTAANQPTYTLSGINGVPTVSFDATDDYIEDADGEAYINGLSEFTIFSVTESNTMSHDKGFFDTELPDGADDVLAIRFDKKSPGNVVRTLAINVNGSTNQFLATDRNTQTTSGQLISLNWKQSENLACYLDGSLDPSVLTGSALTSTLSGSDRVIIGRGPQDASSAWDGYVSEFIIYNTKLDTCKRKIIENYLAAKYGLSILNDLYAHEAANGKGVAGIGRENAADRHIEAQSAGILTLKNATNMHNGEYVIFGHDDASITEFTSTDVPNTDIQRLAREWRLTETGDVGKVDMEIDITGFPSLPVGHTTYVLLVDNDGTFATGSSIYGLTQISGNIYGVTGADIIDADFITIGSTSNISIAGGDFNTLANWATGSVPTSGESAIIATNNSMTLAADITVGDAYIFGGATLNLGSYTLGLNSGTITNNGTFNANTGAILYNELGAQTIANVAYNNLLIAGTGTKTLSANIVIPGNLTITTGTLDVDGTSNFSINIGGNFSVASGNFNAQAGDVTFDGSGLQTITSNSNSFYNLICNNTGSGLSINDNLTVANILTLTDGVITTGSNNLIITNTDAVASIVGFTANSFVNGYLSRYILSNTSTYSFPVGSSTEPTGYFRADVGQNNLIGVNSITASIGALTNHDDADMVASDAYLTYTSIHTGAIWTISPDAQPTGGDYDIYLYTTYIFNLVDNEFGPLKRPEGSTSGADWTDDGGTMNPNNASGRLVADGFALRKGLTSFSEFGVGESDAGTGLPIELIYFDAQEQNDEVSFMWATATESNNDFFTIERSEDAVNFQPINTITGAGNSTTVIEYSDNDINPLEGVSYYRLKQTDFDGQFTYSDIVSIKLKEPIVDFQAYPNPVEDGRVFIKTKILPVRTEKIIVTISDSQGKMVKNQTYEFNGEIEINLFEENSLKPGYYTIEILSETNKQYKRILVL